MMNKKIAIYTLGCRVNQYESCAIAERLREKGYTITKNNDAEYYIVNTCAVTAESERKSRQIARRCALKGKTLVIGCASQIDESFIDIDNVIYIGGNRDKSAVIDVITECFEGERYSVTPMEKAEYEDMYIEGKDELFSECRAFIKIQDGCNGKCTYCIIPKCRGPVRSRNLDDILNEAECLVNNGYHEVILTGIEVSAYNKIPLYNLIKSVSEINGIYRVRLGSLSPNIISENFLKVVSECKNFMPHIHLSLQSCCDSVLSAMKRPYRKKDIYERVELIRHYLPNCMLSADIIVGFPGETEAAFQETLNALCELQIFHVHSFPYSERKGTPAATMPNKVPKHIRIERNGKLISQCEENKKRILNELIGQNFSVLIEKIVDGFAYGHTENFYDAFFDNSECCYKVGDIVNIQAISNDGNMIKGSILK